MRNILAWLYPKNTSSPGSAGQDAEVEELRSKMQREATKFSLVSKIALRSSLLNEMIGVRDQNNDHH